MRYALLSAVFRLFSLVPVRLQRALAWPLGSLGWALSRTKRSSTIRNLQACYPELPEAARERLGRASMRHYMLIALETGISWYRSRERFLALFDAPAGIEHMQAAQDSGRGVLVLAPHSGNWELLNQWMQNAYEMASLYKPGRFPGFERKLLAKRRRFGGALVPTTTAGLKALVGHLRDGKTALLLPDQDPSEGQGRFAPFFGIPALTGVFASRLARQTGCRAVFAICARSARGRFRIHFLPAEAAFYSKDLDDSLAALNRGVERCIEIDPQQYLWAYKRFKTRPEGEARFY